MKNTIKKIKEGIFIGFGFILIIGISGIVYASFSWNIQSDVISGENLSASAWNDLLNNQNYLKQEIESINSASAEWPAGNYCILRAGGICPTGFTASSGNVSAFSGYSVLNNNYYSNTYIGNSFLGAHGGDTFPYGNLAQITLHGCCK